MNVIELTEEDTTAETRYAGFELGWVFLEVLTIRIGFRIDIRSAAEHGVNRSVLVRMAFDLFGHVVPDHLLSHQAFADETHSTQRNR